MGSIGRASRPEVLSGPSKSNQWSKGRSLDIGVFPWDESLESAIVTWLMGNFPVSGVLWGIPPCQALSGLGTFLCREVWVWVIFLVRRLCTSRRRIFFFLAPSDSLSYPLYPTLYVIHTMITLSPCSFLLSAWQAWRPRLGFQGAGPDRSEAC